MQILCRRIGVLQPQRHLSLLHLRGNITQEVCDVVRLFWRLKRPIDFDRIREPSHTKFVVLKPIHLKNIEVNGNKRQVKCLGAFNMSRWIIERQFPINRFPAQRYFDSRESNLRSQVESLDLPGKAQIPIRDSVCRFGLGAASMGAAAPGRGKKCRRRMT